MSRIYNGIKSYWAKPEANEKKEEVSVLLVIALAIEDKTNFRFSLWWLVWVFLYVRAPLLKSTYE